MDNILLTFLSSPKKNVFNIQSITLRTISVLFTVCLFSGCSSLGGGSVQKRSAKLSNGIQKAYSVSPTTANRVSPLIVQSADQYNLDPLMLAALIRQESTYRSQVVSSAEGLDCVFR